MGIDWEKTHTLNFMGLTDYLLSNQKIIQILSMIAILRRKLRNEREKDSSNEFGFYSISLHSLFTSK